jgi:hypothetical protein
LPQRHGGTENRKEKNEGMQGGGVREKGKNKLNNKGEKDPYNPRLGTQVNV